MSLRRFEYAKIRDTSITMIGDRMCFIVVFQFPSYCSEIAGYLDSDGIQRMHEIMETVGVDTWEKLRGKYVWVESAGWPTDISAIRGSSTNRTMRWEGGSHV